VVKDLVDLKFGFLWQVPLFCGQCLLIGMAHPKAGVKHQEFVWASMLWGLPISYCCGPSDIAPYAPVLKHQSWGVQNHCFTKN